MTKTLLEEVRIIQKRLGSTPFPDDLQGIADDANVIIARQASEIIQLQNVKITALEEIERLKTQIRSLDHALNFILSDAAWTPKHPACESIINRINALRKGAIQ